MAGLIIALTPGLPWNFFAGGRGGGMRLKRERWGKPAIPGINTSETIGYFPCKSGENGFNAAGNNKK